MASEVQFNLGDLTLAGLTNGHVGKPIILALHGWLDNAASFLPLLPYLDDYHVVAIDFPGHGLSSHRSADAYYHFVDWVADVATLITNEGWQQVILLGHSMGGMVASVLAAVIPEKIRATVLIDAIGLITTPASQTCEQLRKAITSRQHISSKQKTIHPSYQSALNARVVSGDLGENEARLLVDRGLLATEAGFVWRADLRLRGQSAMRFDDQQAKSFIENIQCPVLYIAGAGGIQQLQRNFQQFYGLYRHLQTQHVLGGHHCHMEYPKQVYQHMANFFVDLAP